MDNYEKVSIIVPIYNVEKYIERCVKSLMRQDYENIQIILVDDGSPDRSFEIVSELANNDERIVVIRQENKGVSSARNQGLKMADGKYLMFVDGDDYVDSNYVSYFVDLIKKQNCDVGFNINNYQIGNISSSDVSFLISSEKAIEWIYSEKIFVAVWNKIYCAKLLKNAGVKFNEKIWYGEGMLFNIEYLQNVEKVAVGEKTVYHQTFNPDSAMRSFNLSSNYCGIRSLEIQKEIWKKKTKKIERAWEYHYYRFNRTIIDGLVRSNLIGDNKSVFNNCVYNIRKNIWIALSNEKKPKKILSWILYCLMPLKMAKRSAKKFKRTVEKIKES